VADTGERKGEPELAIHLPPAESRRYLRRSIDHYARNGFRVFSFKARADKACHVEFEFQDTSSLRIWSGTGMYRGLVDIVASPTRRNYSIFLGASPRELGRFLVIHVPDGVDFWLDNVAFVRERKGPRLGGLAVMYEVGKLLHVGVPSLAAFVVFVVLLFVLRVEEAQSIRAWVTQRVFARLRRGRGQ
jgi:hypothetical protein